MTKSTFGLITGLLLALALSAASAGAQEPQAAAQGSVSTNGAGDRTGGAF